MLWDKTKREAKGAPVRCSWCRTHLAVQGPSGLQPPPRELYAHGALSVKQLGWFCGRRCFSAYEVRFRVILEPELSGVTESNGS